MGKATYYLQVSSEPAFGQPAKVSLRDAGDENELEGRIVKVLLERGLTRFEEPIARLMAEYAYEFGFKWHDPMHATLTGKLTGQVFQITLTERPEEAAQ